MLCVLIGSGKLMILLASQVLAFPYLVVRLTPASPKSKVDRFVLCAFLIPLGWIIGLLGGVIWFSHRSTLVHFLVLTAGAMMVCACYVGWLRRHRP